MSHSVMKKWNRPPPRLPELKKKAAVRRDSAAITYARQLFSGAGVVLILSVIAFYHFMVSGGSPVTANTVPEITLQSTYGVSAFDPCAGKERCVGLFMRPADVSYDLLEFIDGLRYFSRGTSRVGFKVIIGGSSEDEFQAVADRLGGQIFFDGDNTLASALNLQPGLSWLVWDSQYQIMTRHIGIAAQQSEASDPLEAFLSDSLGLGDYLY